MQENRIDFNLELFRKSFEDAIQNSAPQELSHLLAHKRGLTKGGRIRFMKSESL
jgi:predicted SprT family Zn-dependent metalloprotease